VLLKEMYPKAPKKTDTLFWNKWKAELSKKLKGQYQILNPKLEELTIAELVKRANGTKSIQIKGLKKIKNPKKWASKVFKKTLLTNPTQFYAMIEKEPWIVYNSKDKLVALAEEMLPYLRASSEEQTAVSLKLDEQLPQLLESKIKYMNQSFVPDANSTLRFTYGYISGYKEGLNKHPQPYTYRKEIFEKNIRFLTLLTTFRAILDLI
jgi:hypothetical protein